MKTSHAANDGRIVAKTAVAVDLAPVREQALDIVERLRTLRMPRQFRFLPGGLQAFHFLPEDVDALLKFRKLAVGLLVLPGSRLDQRHLPLDLLQFLLRFLGCFHGLIDCTYQLITRTLPRPHNCSTRAMKLRSGMTL